MDVQYVNRHLFYLVGEDTLHILVLSTMLGRIKGIENENLRREEE